MTTQSRAMRSKVVKIRAFLFVRVSAILKKIMASINHKNRGPSFHEYLRPLSLVQSFLKGRIFAPVGPKQLRLSGTVWLIKKLTLSTLFSVPEVREFFSYLFVRFNNNSFITF